MPEHNAWHFVDPSCKLSPPPLSSPPFPHSARNDKHQAGFAPTKAFTKTPGTQTEDEFAQRHMRWALAERRVNRKEKKINKPMSYSSFGLTRTPSGRTRGSSSHAHLSRPCPQVQSPKGWEVLWRQIIKDWAN